MADSGDERVGSNAREINGQNPNAISFDESQSKKICTACGTSKTPLWRGGPVGPKSLCNACGIKSRKKRGPVMEMMRENTEVKKKKKKKKRSRDGGGKSKYLGLGREGLVKILMVEGLRRKLGEEEEAAVLLMAISCGYSVYA